MLRGVDDTGQNLIIAREYISHGIRERAAELVTLDLGPRTDQEIEARLRHDIGEERLTAIDRSLARSLDADRLVTSTDRSEERRVGKEWVSECRSRWVAYHSKKKTLN